MLRKATNAGAITHYNMTMESDVDWNDLLKAVGKKKFAAHFLRSIKRVSSQQSNENDREAEESK
jgi:hypothetical protein